MERDGMEEGLLQSSTNFEAQSNTDGGDITPTGASATATPVVVLSTLVALCGSFCTGCAIGYSSPAESGILEDLDISVAAVSTIFSFWFIIDYWRSDWWVSKWKDRRPFWSERCNVVL